jgi:hypothetical protein
MKSRLRRGPIRAPRRKRQFYSGERSVSWKIAQLQAALEAEPVVGRLQRKVIMFGGFQLENGEPPRASSGSYLNDAVLATRAGEDGCMDEPQTGASVDAGCRAGAVSRELRPIRKPQAGAGRRRDRRRVPRALLSSIDVSVLLSG